MPHRSGSRFRSRWRIGFFVGRWLDRVFSTAPWLTVVFTAFGIAGGFLNAIRTALRIGREEDEAAKNGNRESLGCSPAKRCGPGFR